MLNNLFDIFTQKILLTILKLRVIEIKNYKYEMSKNRYKLLNCFVRFSFIVCKMKFKITVMTFFQFVPKDVDKWDPKSSFEVEVSGSNFVADFHTKLTKMIDLRNSECSAEFYRGGFNVGKKLECDEKIEDGETVYAVITTKKKLKEVVDEIRHKETRDKFDKAFDDFFKKSPSKK